MTYTEWRLCATRGCSGEIGVSTSGRWATTCSWCVAGQRRVTPTPTMTRTDMRSAFARVRSGLDVLPYQLRAANTLRARFPEGVRAVAVHESGHAIVALALGAHVRNIRLLGGSRGESDVQGGLTREDEAAVNAAGHVAAIVLGEVRPSAPDTTLTRLGRRELETAIDRAESILRAQVGALYNLAVGLAQRGTLTGDAARAIVKANGARLS